MSGITEIRSLIMQGDIARKTQEPGASHHDTHQAVVAQQHLRMLEKRQLTVQLSEEAQRLRPEDKPEDKKKKEKKERRELTGARVKSEDAGEHPAEDIPESLDVRV